MNKYNLLTVQLKLNSCRPLLKKISYFNIEVIQTNIQKIGTKISVHFLHFIFYLSLLLKFKMYI